MTTITDLTSRSYGPFRGLSSTIHDLFLRPPLYKKRRREDLQPFLSAKKQRSVISQRSVLQISKLDKKVNQEILSLSGHLFANVLSFLADKDQECFSASSRRADMCRWNAHILKELPKAYGFYRRVLESERPCRRHWDALCEAQKVIEEAHRSLIQMNLPAHLTYATSLNHSHCLIGDDVEPFPHLLVREAFPQYSILALKPIKLALDFNENRSDSNELKSSKSLILQSIAYKLNWGFCTNGMLGERVFYTFGEIHNSPEDETFTQWTRRACEKQIALFEESTFAAEKEEIQRKECFGISPQAIYKGLDCSDRNIRILQVLADLLTRAYSPTPSFDARPFTILLDDLFATSSNAAVLYNALRTNLTTFSSESVLAQAIFDAVSWYFVDDDPIGKDELQNIHQIIKTHPASASRFLQCLGRCLLKESSRFTRSERQALGEAIHNPSVATALQCDKLFMKKRETFFAKSFLNALPLIPPSRILVAIVGSSHQWNFFSEVTRRYYRNSKKYAFRKYQ